MNYIRCGGSEKVTIDGVKVRDKMELSSLNVNNLVLNKNSRCFFYANQAVVYNGEIYVLNQYGLYKSKDGSEWELAATYPLQTACNGWLAVVYNGEIHFFYNVYHVKWDGETWTSLANMPASFSQGSAVVCSGEIHLLGGQSGPTNHYKWNGTTWTSLPSLPYQFSQGSAVELNNEIYLLGGGYTVTNYFYKWNGTTWTSLPSLPYADRGIAVVYNGEIHFLGGAEDTANFNRYSNCNKHYKYNGVSWVKLDDIITVVLSGSTIYLSGVCGGFAFVCNNEIYVTGHMNSTGYTATALSYWCRVIDAKVYHQ